KGILRDFNAPPGRGPRRDACLSASQHLLHRRRRVRLASASEVTLCGQRLRYLPIAAVRATRAPAPLPPAPERSPSHPCPAHRPPPPRPRRVGEAPPAAATGRVFALACRF